MSKNTPFEKYIEILKQAEEAGIEMSPETAARLIQADATLAAGHIIAGAVGDVASAISEIDELTLNGDVNPGSEMLWRGIGSLCSSVDSIGSAIHRVADNGEVEA